MKKFVGLDVGSVSVKLAVLDTEGNILKTKYVRHKGRPLIVAYELLKSVTRDVLCVMRFKDSPLLTSHFSLSITGSAGRLIAHIFGIEPVNEIVAQSYSTRKLYPQVKTIFEMGGEDSKLILLENGKVKEFSMNSVCAAGTGSFLDQQAERLRLSIEEFSEIALRAKNPPRIAGRCSVFAKSDMIHLQQIATPMEDIVAGLCFAVARNFKGSICKNMRIPEPVSFQGGVAANKGVVRAFKEVFGLDNLIIPQHFALMPAIGAALKDIKEGKENTCDIEKLRLFIESHRSEEKGYEPLREVESSKFKVKSCQKSEVRSQKNAECEMRNVELKSEIRNQKSEIVKSSSLVTCHSLLPVKAYLGIDIGSISTNLAVIDKGRHLISKRYLMTAGRPIEAVRQGLDEIGREIGDKVQILGVGTTGSGRYMIADYVGADIVKNEITAQATAAIEIDPQVDTIFEIGGQDSKFISLKDGVVVDFEMNKACAAGTGSFLEEQAEKLDISIKEEFSEMAFKSARPCPLGERCTVFMENSLLSKQQRGIPKEDLVAGLSYSIVQNYINRVVAGRKIGNRIFFQGGVAFNKAVVSAFERYLDKKITVPPHHDVTGAIGMALIAMRYIKGGYELRVTSNELKDKDRNSLLVTCPSSLVTKFKGFDLSKRKYEIKSFGCKGCENLCEINSVQIEGEKEPLFYGSRCEKYDVKKKKRSLLSTALPDLFAEREELLTKAHLEYKERFKIPASAGRLWQQHSTFNIQRHRIGIPRIFYFHDLLPFWNTLLWELGFDVEVSAKTNRQIIQNGAENILAESCFPHKSAHGHIKDLIDKNVDAILIPSFINLNPPNKGVRGFACPYVQTMPYIAKTVFRKMNSGFSNGARFLTPIVNMELGKEHFLKEIYKTLRPYHISMYAIKKASIKAEDAQTEFVSAIKDRGKEVLKNLNGKTIAIVGRSYNAFDSGINLDIPKKLSDLGILSIPMDFLPIEGIDITKTWPNMYWMSGQNILSAAEIIRDIPNLFALYIGNFSCGPDSFIHRYFKETMGRKPFLNIEIDEHSADAGVITRCEAFLDSISRQPALLRKARPGESEVSRHMRLAEARSQESQEKIFYSSRFTPHASRIVFIPRMSDHAFGLAAAFEACGVDAEVLDEPDIETVKIGRRYISGKECYPFAITTGDMIHKARSKDFDPERSAFFMPSGTGPCRFGQYNVLHRLILDEIGFPNVPIFSPNQDSSFYNELNIVGKEFTKHAWKGIIAIELLLKCLHETRPYEINMGESETLYKKYLLKISRAVKSHNGAVPQLLKEMRRDFSMILKTDGRKPVIGIIGEIFVRHNAFSNEDIIKKVEGLGGEVWLAPVEEWLYYVNSMALKKSMIKFRNNFSMRNAQEILNILITRFFQKKIEHKFSSPLKGFLKTLREPSTAEILKNASPYLHKSFEGEAVLSIGKAIDFVKNNVSGIISIMPFGCMPGTIVDALLKGLKYDTSIPCLSTAYDGVETTCSEIQLEAFMHQTHEYSKQHVVGSKQGKRI